MKTIASVLFTIALIFFLNGCASPPPATPETEAHYKLTQNPPSGLGRVYILPESHQSVLGDYVIAGKVLVGTAKDQTSQAGELTDKRFAAFDVKAGSLFIQFSSLLKNPSI